MSDVGIMRRCVAAAAAIALVAVLPTAVTIAGGAQALNPGPETVTGMPMPTYQTNGTVFAIKIINNVAMWVPR
ncbi:MAG: hypothetical protein Q8P61_09250 [Candidatus Nanopelagicales bacterium]|nr:hypothetical protein [Candidatus Nanopelagicales bacterium]